VAVVASALAVSCGPGALSVWGYYTHVSRSPLVDRAIAAAEAHPTVREVLGAPLTVHTLVTRDQDLSYSSGGTSYATPFWRPGVTRRRISMITTIDGPRGSAWFTVSGTEDLTDGSWRDVRMTVDGADLGEVRSFAVDLARPEDPGTVVRGP
jgi:hypothetical protein